MDAAGRLLETRPLEDISVGDLIAEADVSRATFYVYFESKPAVIAALAEDVFLWIHDNIWKDWFGGQEPVDLAHLERHMRQSLETWQAHRGVLGAAGEAWRSQASLFGVYEDAMRSYVAGTRRFIERAQADGSTPPAMDPETTARVLVWGLESVLYLSVTDPAMTDLDLIASNMALVWMRTIYGDAGV